MTNNEIDDQQPCKLESRNQGTSSLATRLRRAVLWTERQDDVTIPFLLSGPSVPANHPIARSVRITDIAPTITHLFGISSPEAWIGAPIAFSALS